MYGTMAASAAFVGTPSLFATNGLRVRRLRGHLCGSKPRAQVTYRQQPIACAKPDEKAKPEPKATEDKQDGRATSSLFGLRVSTNGDVIKFGIIAILVAYAFKAGLTVFGVNDLLAGQITTGVVSVASLLAWVSTYVFRVGTKGMTYAQQLRDYESAVLEKRYEELTPEELAALREELRDGD